MTSTLPPGLTDADILDFTPPEDQLKPKVFRVGPADDDVFVAAASIPVGIAADFAKGMAQLREVATEAEAIDRVLTLFGKVLWPEHVERFTARFYDVKRPIDHRMLQQIMEGLLDRWGLRPPEPPGSSSGGEPDREPGTSSEAAPPSLASTSQPSPSTGSATSSTASSPTAPTPATA